MPIVEPVIKEVPEFLKVGMIFAGHSFGELALINNKPRAATIHCEEGCHFAVMSKKDYKECLIKIE
jgi:CRP-like cAMP-binding protein